MKKLLTCCMLLALALTLSAAAAQAEGLHNAPTSILEYYQIFVSEYFMFAKEDPTPARILAAQDYLDAHSEIRSMPDAQGYVYYLNGLDALSKGSFTEALNHFASIQNRTKPLDDTETLYQYCAGRLAEQRLNYAEAIRCYQIAYSYGDAQKRMLDCHKAISSEDESLTSSYQVALDLMALENYFTAATLFKAIADLSPDFFYCEKMYHYCSGRVAENNADYAAAIEHYSHTLTYGDSRDRLVACSMKQEEATSRQANARILAADDLYQRGVSRKDEELLLQARSIYDELGENAKADQCTAQIERIEDQQDYDRALEQYRTAEAAGSVAGLKLAAASFEALDGYSDSAAMAAAIHTLIEKLERKLTITAATADTTGISLTWSDSSTAASTYIVSWSIQNVPQADTLSTTKLSCTLSGLLPGTVYEITICPDGLPELTQKVSCTTSHAPVYKENSFTISSLSVYSVSRISLKLRTLEEAMAMYNDVEIHQDNRIALDPVHMAFQPRVYIYYVSYRMAAVPTEPVSYQLILRTPSAGTYAGVRHEDVTIQHTTGCFYLELEPLLDAMYTTNGEWPQETCTVEMYINDQLAAKGTLTLGQ